MGVGGLKIANHLNFGQFIIYTKNICLINKIHLFISKLNLCVQKRYLLILECV